MRNPNTPIIKDWYLLGLTTGIASAAVKSSLNYLASRVGFATSPYGALAGDMILGRRPHRWWAFHRPVRSRPEQMVGYLADLVFGGIFGVAASYVYSKTPPGNEILKGALGGSALWALTFMVPNQMSVSQLKADQMVTLLGIDVLYGVMQGALIGRFGAKLIDQSHPVLVKPVTNQEFNRARLATRRNRMSLM